MFRAFQQFKNNIKYVKELDALYSHLKNDLYLPNDLTDILRAELVYTVSALDKLIHEFIRIGMIESFNGRRNKTTRFLSFGISFDTHTKISSLVTEIPTPEYWFEREIVLKHKQLSFQDPDKISDGLCLIWDDDHKWQKIATYIGTSQHEVKTRLKTVISRRNQIVHEADIDFITGKKSEIDKSDIDSVILFVEQVAEAIFNIIR